MATLHVVRVFVGPGGSGGNPLGVFLEGADIPQHERQALAHELGYSETVFVDDVHRGVVRIFTPDRELPFAGHPLVGTSWLLSHEGLAVEVVRPPAGEVATWSDAQQRVWIRGRPAWAPDFVLEQLADPHQVNELAGPPDGVELFYAWAWEDEARGVIRARMFAPALGVPEDEATGAAAVRLAGRLQRELVINQGLGSILHAKPGPGDTVDVGGSVVCDDVRDHPVSA